MSVNDPRQRDQSPPPEERKNAGEDEKKKNRLKDLDVTDREGNFVKGGIPKQPDCDF